MSMLLMGCGAGPQAAAGAPAITTTWSPTDKTAAITLSNGNLTATANLSGIGTARSTTGRLISDAGKYYCELQPDFTVTTDTSGVGIATDNWSLTTGYLGDGTKTGIAIYDANSVYYNGAVVLTLSNPDLQVISIALRADGGSVRAWFAVGSGNWNNSGTANPATDVGGIILTALSGASLYGALALGRVLDKVTGNFGASAAAGKGLYSGAVWLGV